MKRIFALMVAMVMAFGLVISSDICIDEVWYDLNDEDLTATITFRGEDKDSYANEYPESPFLPPTVVYNGKTYKVTAIGDYAFYQCTVVWGISVPDNITKIGEHAFAETGFLSVFIPGSVVSMGESIFMRSHVERVEFGYGITTIPDNTFILCEKLKEVVIPGSVTTIGWNAFTSCSSLEELYNYATVPQEIVEYVFGGGTSHPAVNKSTCKLYVPKESVELYKDAPVWKEFGDNIIGVDAPQALRSTVTNDTAPITNKRLVQGQLVIEHNNKLYNAIGARVK